MYRKKIEPSSAFSVIKLYPVIEEEERVQEDEESG